MKSEGKRAIESLIFLSEKKNGISCANGSTQWNNIGKEQMVSPTMTTESILMIATIDAKQGRDVMEVDVPSVFVQTEIPPNERIEKIIMKIKGYILNEMSLETYANYITIKNEQCSSYISMVKAFYRM